MDEEWKIYREYLMRSNPDDATVFMAEEALQAMINGYDDEFNRNVARYNLVCIYIRSKKYDLARELIQQIQKSRDPLDVADLIDDLRISEKNQYLDDEVI